MKLSERCYAVTGLGAVAPWAVNAGFIVGDDKTLVIDTGASRLAAQTIAGYARAVRPKNELIVFNSEPHFDHIGGNSYFHELGIDIYGHATIARTAEQFVGEHAEYNETIVNDVRRTANEAEAFYAGTSVSNPNKHVDAGHVFELGGVSAEILATPGHTAINRSIYCKDENVLYCADCIVTDYIANLEASGVEEWRQWLQSLEMIEALQPAIITPGHGNILRGDSDISAQIVRMRETVKAAIVRGKAPTL